MSETTEQTITIEQKEALKFFERDFNQCFEQLRHYDTQSLSILKFMFAGYTALIAAALGFYQFCLKEGVEIVDAVIAALSVGLIIGTMMFALVVRNRVYFVHVARYINEQRMLFFQYKPLGFSNLSLMYTNCFQPPYFNWRSSQAWFMYLIAALNSTIASILAVNVSMALICKWEWVTVVIVGILFFIFQLMLAIGYLNTRERKSASKAAFGKE